MRVCRAGGGALVVGMYMSQVAFDVPGEVSFAAREEAAAAAGSSRVFGRGLVLEVGLG